METVDVGTAQIAFRREGTGSPLLLLHGWPLTGATWRKVLPRLAERFTCIVPDSPGLGATRWSDAHDFGFVNQANAYARFVEQLGFTNLAVLAHDTGATLARQLSLLLGEKVKKLVLIDTEMPGHRPPFIPLFQTVTRAPGAGFGFRQLLRSQAFIRSPMGFGGVFVNQDLLRGEFHDLFIAPLIRDARKMEGVVRYLQGIDWAMVDGFAQRHAEISAKTLLVWGEDDTIFPVARAEAMVGQFKHCVGLKRIAGAALLPHEEKPNETLDHVLPFLVD